MVIRGRTRGNGRQLAAYLLEMKDNEDIRILDVAGRDQANDNFLHNTLLSMSLTSELTKSDKGLYHAQINPAYGDDRAMDSDSWLKAADLLGKELGLEDQRRIIVLHTKKDRTHAHVVWERYDHEKKIMVSDSFSRLAQDRARLEMERVFEQKQTPKRNEKRPEMKKVLSDLWQKVKTGAEFIKSAKTKGYMIAAGVQRRPFMVVDDTGRSFDLVRQLGGVKTREVRERLKGEKLIAEKDAIALIRTKQKLEEKIRKEKSLSEAEQQIKNESIAAQFGQSSQDIIKDENKLFSKRKENIAKQFAEGRTDIIANDKETEQRKTEVTSAFKLTKDEIVATSQSELDEKERKRQEILEQIKQNQKKKNKDQGKEPD